jgi:hypothetical protein
LAVARAALQPLGRSVSEAEFLTPFRPTRSSGVPEMLVFMLAHPAPTRPLWSDPTRPDAAGGGTDIDLRSRCLATRRPLPALATPCQID